MAGLAFFLVAGTLAGWGRPLFDDLLIYQDATGRLLAGEGWYLPRQLGGPYPIAHGDVLYPPVAFWFFLPWLVLPAWTFAAIPIGVLVWFIASCRPGAWTWPLIALCVAYPITLIYAIYANPSLWVAAFVALGLRYRWPGALVLLKPSLAPFALVGIRSRGWWIALVVLAVASLPFLADTLAYPGVVLNGQGGSLLYSAVSVPLVLIPIIAWLGRQRAPELT